jgi:hypothetical protein
MKSSKLYQELISQVEVVGGVPCEQAPDLFFMEKGDPMGPEKIRLSKIMCAECPVRLLCLQYAIEANEHDGIWGGLTRNEREGFGRRKRAA